MPSRTALATVAFTCSLLGLPVAAACPDRPRAPGGEWTMAPAPDSPARKAAVAALEAYAFAPRQPARLGVRTDGVVIVSGEGILYERYGDGQGPASRHVAWSCTKSFTSALVGVALARGALGLDDSICAHLPPPGQHCDVTVRHLLQLASGLDWNEGDEGGRLQEASVLAMLYGVGRKDMAAFVRSQPRLAPPGTRWNYSSGDSVLLSAVVRAALEPRLGPDWLARALLEPMEMRSAVVEADAAGTPVGSSLLHATPRDLARLGLLYLADGCWRGERLLPEGYVAASTSVSGPSASPGGVRQPGDVYGLGWWLNRRVPALQPALPWPDVPEDAFAARGHWGQVVAVVPSRGLVVVRTADDREPGAFDLGRFLALAVAVGATP